MLQRSPRLARRLLAGRQLSQSQQLSPITKGDMIWDYPIFEYLPTESLEGVVHGLHHLGLPWWGALFTAAVFIRTPFLPIQIMSMREMGKFIRFMPLLEAVKQQTMPRFTFRSYLEYRRMTKPIKREYGYSSLRRWASLIQLPVLILMIITLRRVLYRSPLIPLSEEGIQLLTSDMTMFLPILGLSMMYINSIMLANTIPPGFVRKLTEVMTYSPPFLLYMTYTLPQGVFYFWMGSSAYAFVYLCVIHNPRVRLALGLPSSRANPLDFSSYQPSQIRLSRVPKDQAL